MRSFDLEPNNCIPVNYLMGTKNIHPCYLGGGMGVKALCSLGLFEKKNIVLEWEELDMIDTSKTDYSLIPFFC